MTQPATRESADPPPDIRGAPGRDVARFSHGNRYGSRPGDLAGGPDNLGIAVMREILDIPVGELMSKPAVTVRPETSIEELTRLMAEHDYNGFPVVDGVGLLQGLVTRLDLFKLYLVPYTGFIPALEDAWTSSVRGIMSRGVLALYPVEPALRAIAIMVEHRIRTLPVVSDEVAGPTVVGVLTRRDLSKALKT